MKYQSPYSGAHTIYLHHEGNDVKEYDEASIANLPPLEVDRQALAQLAEVGVIPSPASPYKNFKILNAGDHATFDKQTDSLVCGTHFAYGRSDSAHQTLELNQFLALHRGLCLPRQIRFYFYQQAKIQQPSPSQCMNWGFHKIAVQ